MMVIEMNAGTKIKHTINGNKLTLNDEMTLDLSKYERDFDVHIDVCMNGFGMLTMGLSEKYVAQIEIPARGYIEVPGAEGEETTFEPVPFLIDNVILTLWSIEQ